MNLYKVSECQQIKIARGIVVNKYTIKGSTTVLYNIKGLAELRGLLDCVNKFRQKSEQDKSPELLEMSKVLQQNMIYFLYNNISGVIYIGEAGQRSECFKGNTRLGEHLIPGNDYYYGKWNEVQFVVSDRDDIDQDIMDRVEAILIKMAFDQVGTQDDSYEVLNHKQEQINDIPKYYKKYNGYYCFTIISDIQNMLSSIGCDIFNDIQQETVIEQLLRKIQKQLTSENDQINNSTDIKIANSNQAKLKYFNTLLDEKVCEVQTPKRLIESQLQLIDWNNVDEHTTFLNIACKDGGYIKALILKLFEVEKDRGCFKEFENHQDTQIIMNILNNQLFGLVTTKNAVVTSRLGAYYFDDIGLISSINNIRHIPYFSDSLIKGDIVYWLDKIKKLGNDYCEGFYSKFSCAAELAQWAVDERCKQLNEQQILQPTMREQMLNELQAILTTKQSRQELKNIVRIIKKDKDFQKLYIDKENLSDQEKKHNNKVIVLYKKIKRQVLAASIVDAVLRKEFGIMNFDIVIGNPPYQDGEKGNTQIYQYFIECSLDIAKVGVNMVTNSHWFGRDTMKSTRDRMIKAGITDIIDYPKIGDMFKTVQVPVAIFNINKKNHPKTTRYSKYIDGRLVDTQDMILNVGDIICSGVTEQIIQKITGTDFQSMSSQVIPWSGFGIETNLTVQGGGAKKWKSAC